MKQNNQKILFMVGAFCIITGIIIAKINHTTLNIIGILMIALGAIFMSTNIIMRLIQHSKKTKK